MIKFKAFIPVLFGLLAAAGEANAALVPADKAELGAPANYIENGGCERSTAGWKTYADAAAASPVDGTGGSPNVTITSSTTNPLEGNASCILTKGAANRQGEGWSYNFSIGRGQQGKVMQVSFDYEVASGTYDPGSDSTDSDITAWIYDVSNATLLGQLTPYKVLGGTTQLKFQGRFQTAASGTAYRLILHESKTGTSAFTVKVDNFYVGPQVKSFGAPVTDWKEYSLTIGATTSAPTKASSPTIDKALWRRVGDKMEIRYDYYKSGAATGAANGSGNYLFPIPSGYTIDTTKFTTNDLQGDNTYTSAVCGSGTARNSNANSTFTVWAIAKDASNIALIGVNDVAGPTVVGASFVELNQPGTGYSFFCSVPISGWSSNVQVSSDADTRVVSLRVPKTSTQTLSDNTYTDVTSYDAVAFDTHAAFNTSTGVYTVPVPGKYQVHGHVSFAASGTGHRVVRVIQNATTVLEIGIPGTASGAHSVPYSVTLNAVAGDTIKIAALQTSGGNLNIGASGTGYHLLNIDKLGGPEQIAANELIAARYTRDSTQALASGAEDIANFDDKDFDTHNAVTTGASWKFTAPAAGKYNVNAMMHFGASANGSRNISVWINGVRKQYLSSSAVNAAGAGQLVNGSALVHLNAGDYIDVRATQNSGGSLDLGLSGDATGMAIDIRRVGF